MRLSVVADFPSRAEGVRHTIRIFRPLDPRRGDTASEDAPAGVLVAQDGQNLFTASAAPGVTPWDLDGALDDLVGTGRIGRWWVVAVDHRGSHRIGDYAPWRDPIHPDGPRGGAYASFVVDELLPYVRRELGAPADPARWAIVGSSMGGLIALYIAATYPDRIGRVAALSPSAMWANGELYRYWDDRRGSDLSRIYADAGAREQIRVPRGNLDYGSSIRRLERHLVGLGYSTERLRVVVDPVGEHNERCWARRLPSALAWLLV